MNKNGPGSLNRIYRLVWNERTGTFVAVAESAKGRGKRNSGVCGAVLAAALVLGGNVALAAGPPAANALPQKGTVVSGQASLQQGVNRLDITQGTNRAAINWQSFDIGSAAQVNIVQPGAQSVLLNRVLGADPSGIYGRLSANGQVLLVNANGIVFGKGSQVDVGGLVASSLDIADADFNAGRMNFTRAGKAGAVTNRGTLNAAAGGYVALLAPEVVNEGVVSARLGTVALAAGDAVTLALDGNQLLGVKVDPSTIDALVENRQLVQAEGGRVILSAGAAQRLREQAVAGATGANALVAGDNGAMRLVVAGGRIEAGSGQINLSGSTVDASGSARGAAIAVQADHLSQGGVLDASGAAAGGRITIDAGAVVQTASAQLKADGGTAGGDIRVTGGAAVYSSATFSAQGAAGQGGEIALSADSVQLRAATLDASGASGGGRVRVGGGFQGRDSDIANARNVGINGTTLLRADATVRGDGGQVVVWADEKTVYGGSLSARAGAGGGNGGRAEVSGKGDLTFAGKADLAAPQGAAGQLLLDPRNILIDNAGNSLASLDLADPTPSDSNGFGTFTQVLANGNVIISAPGASTGAQGGTGAVYLFNSQTGALLSNLRGSHAGDHAGGGGVQVLGNGNYLVLSPQYGTVSGVNTFSTSRDDPNAVPGASAYAIQQNGAASAGAISWQSGTGSSSSAIGSGNSLLGSTANTESVTRYSYSGSTINNNGSVTITANDRLGNVTTYDMYGGVAVEGTTRIVELADGNVAIAATNWFNGRGAVAWMNGSTGALANAAAGGAVSSANALVGSTGIRSLAPSVTDSNSRKVYVTGLDSSLPFTYTQGSTNRRLAPPGAAGDSIGSTVTALPDGGYVIASPLFTNGAGLYAGAATHGAAGGSSGTVSAANSLVGSSSFDFVSSGGVSVVGGGSGYVVASPYWTDSGNAAVGRYLENNPNGAVTWVAGSTGLIFGAGSSGAAVSPSNSLTGGDGDLFGSRGNGGSQPTTTYDYTSGGSLTTTTSTRVTTAGSGVTVLKNGNYLVTDIDWNGSRGAVAFGTGAAGVGGAVGAGNALIGASAGDGVGSGGVLELSGSNYLVLSPYADIGSADGGAATWAAGSSGLVGAIGTGNSLYGTAAGSRVGLGGAFGVGSVDGQGLHANAIVLSPEWGNRSSIISTVAYGAVTWVDGSNGHATGQGATGGAVSSANSLVGHHDGDYVGSLHSADQRAVLNVGDGSNLQQVQGNWNAVLGATVDILANGDYLVRSPNWDSGKGAVTWGAGGAGVAGTISSANSLVGSVSDVLVTSTSSGTRAGMNFTDTTYRLTTTGDHVGLLSETLAGGNAITISPWWNGGRGAVTWIGSGNRTGTIGSSNSLVGSTPDTYSDANHSAITATGDRLGTMPDTTWVVPVISEAAVGGNTLTTASLRPVGPYAMSSGSNVVSESWFSGGGSATLGKAYSVTATVNLQTSEEWGYLRTNFRYNGVSIVKELANGSVLVASPGWNNGAAAFAGAISWINGSTGALTGGGTGGSVSATNSLVGSHAGDLLGLRLPVDGVAELTNGNFVLLNPQWYDERGAATWGSGTAGVAGTVSASNSLVGSTGSTGLAFAPLNNVYRITHGAVLSGDWLDRVSNNEGDRVGAAGVTALADGNAVIGSPLWQQSSAWTQTDAPTSLGAVTWINGSTGALRTGAAGGSISSANSLVGTMAGDAVGYSPWVDPYSGLHDVASGVTALAGGRYAVASPWWSNGATANVGAVTFAPAGGLAGTVSASNSLVGASAGDHVGRSLSSVDALTYGAQIDAGVVALDLGNGTVNYMVRSVDWTSRYGTGTGTAAAGAGAVTWVDGSNGHAYGQAGTGAVVSEANSLTGSSAGDAVGQQSIVLKRGNGSATGDLLLLSNLASCGVDGVGAITLLSGAHGAAGPVGWRNSLIGVAAADAGLATTGFDGWTYSTDVRATLLPTAVTAAEQVAARPLVWVAPNATSGKNASHAYALTLLGDDNAVANGANQVNGSNGNANWTGSYFAGNGAGMAGVGTSSGTLAFATHSGSDVVITPAALTALLNAGTAVTLQASNDITVLRDVITSAGGAGGNLTLEAGRSVYIRANIDTDNGSFTAIANQSASAGVVDAHCSTCVSIISQAEGTRIDTGNNYLTLRLQDSSDKTSNAAGTLRVSSVDGFFIQLANYGFDAGGQGRGIRFNPGAVVGSSGTDRLELFVGGNSAAGGSIVLAADTQLIGRDAVVVAPSDLNHGMVLGAANGGASLALTAAEVGAVVHQSTGFNAIQFGSGDQVGTLDIHTLDFTQAAMLRPGSSTLNANLRFSTGNGLRVLGALTLAMANGRNAEVGSWGDVSLAAAGSITATTGSVSILGARWLGTAALTQASGSHINVTSLSLGMEDSIDLSAGTNTIGTLSGQAGTTAAIKTTSSLAIGNGGFSADSGVVLQASGASSDITLNSAVSNNSGDLVLAAGRNFVNNTSSNTGIAAGSGRYLVYSTNPTATTEGMTGYAKHYAQSYSAGVTPAYAASGSWFLYSVAPTITVSAGSGSTVTYGSGAAAPSLSVTGFIDGDTLGSATTGSLNSSLSSYTPSSAGYRPVGTYTLTLTGQGTLASSLGYAISVTPGSAALTVQPKAINLSGLTANSKVYDGTTATTVSGTGSLQNGGSGTSDGRVFSADTVSLSGTATGAFADRHVGNGKSVTLSGLTLNGADAGNYTISAGSVTANITPKALTVGGLSVASSRVYNGNTSATVLGSGALPTSETAGSGSTGDGTPYALDTISLGGTATATYNAASVAGASSVAFGGLTLSGTNAGNYTLGFGTQAATITPKALSLTGVAAQNKVYDATTTASFTGTAALSGVVGSDAVSLAGTLAGSFAGANVGTGIGITTSGLSLSGGAAGNYTLGAYSPSANITARTLTVTADNQAKTYGDIDPALSFGVGGLGLVGGDTLASVFGGALSTTTGAAATAGTHAISQGTLAVSNGNYALGSYTAGTLTVARAQLNVTADNKSKTYGGADPGLSYTVNASQLKYTDSASVVSGVSLATTTGAAATAGTHAITAGGGSAANYDLVLADGTLSVAKAQLAVTADNKTKTYGDADPTLSYTVNAAQLKYSDGASVVSGLNLATATGAAATAGTHAITASGGSAANYDLVLADGTLSVAKAQLQVSADDRAKTYGGADPTLGYTVNAGQLKYTDTAAVVSGVNLATVTGAAATAGTHAITAVGGSAANYDLVLADGTLSVAKAQLQVSADDRAKTYGGADPTLGYTVNAAQLKYTDTAAVVSGVSLATATGAAATAGTHAITASGGSAANYDLVLADGTLSVARAQLQVTADNKGKTYGDADPALSYTVNAAQLKYADGVSVVSGVALATATGAAATAGTHAITASGGSAANYDLVLADGTLSVAKAQLQVTAGNAAKTYGAADPTLGFTVNAAQLKYTDTAAVVSGLSLVTATGAAATAGTHAITASGGSADNYVLALANGTLSVAKAQLQVSADNQAKTYGDADPALSYTVNAAQLKYTDTAAVVSGVALATVSGAAATAGTHAITASGGSAANYDVVVANGVLNVAKASLAVTADNQAKTYGDADPTPGYAINTSQLKYGDTPGVISGLTVSAPTGAAATAGTHAIALGGGSAANYVLVLHNGVLSVAKAELAVTADNKAKTYGDADPALSYTVNAGQLKYADGAGVVSGLTLGTASGAAATAGTHAITLGGGNAANYVLVLNNGTLSVAKAELAVSADNKSKTYGDADPALSYTVNAAQLKYADGAGVVSGLVLGAPGGAAATAGTHAVTLAGGSAANYQLVLSDGVLTVAKAPLAVIADPASKTAGETDPALTWHVDPAQLRHGDSAAVVGGVTLTAPGGAGLPPGTYAIVGANGQAANYALSYVDGVLVVKPSPSVKAENLSTQVPPLAAEQPAAVPPAPGGAQAVAGLALPGTLTVVGGGLALSAPAAAGGSTAAASAGSATGAAAELIGSARLVAVRPVTEVERRPDGGVRFDAAAAFERPPQAKVSYSATLADGRPLPAWMSLDNTSGVLSGAVPPGAPASVEVLVSARLENGEVATTRVRVRTRR